MRNGTVTLIASQACEPHKKLRSYSKVQQLPRFARQAQDTDSEHDTARPICFCTVFLGFVTVSTSK